MQDLVAAIGTVGFPIALVVMMVWFVNTKAWPVITDAVREYQAFEKARNERETKNNERLIGAFEQNTKVLSETMQMIQALSSRVERVENTQRRIIRTMKHRREGSNGD